MALRDLLATLDDLTRRIAGELDAAPPAPRVPTEAPSTPPAGAAPHSIEVASIDHAPAPVETSTVETSSPSPASTPPAGAAPHSIDHAPAPVETSTVETGTPPAESEVALVAPAALRHHLGDVVHDASGPGVVVEISPSAGVRLGRFAAVSPYVRDGV